MTKVKPQGVGIEYLAPKRIVEFGRKKGFIDEDDDTIGMALPDWAIREFITITDFVDYDESPPGTVSYGLTSAGYDIRVGGNFKVFTNARCETVSPKKISRDSYIDFDLTGHDWQEIGHSLGWKKCRGCECMTSDMPKARFRCANPKPDTVNTIKIPPNCFALAETVEVLYIPRNVVCWCIGKSTYARCGINMNFTPFEPGWFGVVTVEIINATPLPVEIYAWEGIGQAEFFLMAGRPERAYGDKKNAKYQGQTGLTLPFVK